MNITHRDKIFVWACHLAFANKEADMKKLVEMANVLSSNVTDEDIAEAQKMETHLAETEGYVEYHEYLKGATVSTNGHEMFVTEAGLGKFKPPDIDDPFLDSFPT